MIPKFVITDFHVHTKWSSDITENGPTFEAYLPIAEKNKINICFLDHYELYHVKNNINYPFYGDGKIEQYIEQMDKIKENFDFVLSGLEVDYYLDKDVELKEFMDNYGKAFDFIAGSLHETDVGLPFTTREKLIELLSKKKIKSVVDEYFELMRKMIESKIFENVCHLDTIFRYINPKDIKPTSDVDVSDERILELGRLCIKNKIRIEYNLSGFRYPISRPFPSNIVIKKLKKEGGEFFIGSDSHSINYFRSVIPSVKKAYKFLNKLS